MFKSDIPVENCITRIGTRFGPELGNDNPLGRFVPFVSVGFQKSALIGYRSVFERKPTNITVLNLPFYCKDSRTVRTARD